MKMLHGPDGFLLYSIFGVDFFSTSELLFPNMKIRLRLIRARPRLYMIIDNFNVILGIVDCSLYTSHFALKDDYHKKANGHACLYSGGVQPFETFCKDSDHSCQTKPINSKKTFSTMLQFFGLLSQ